MRLKPGHSNALATSASGTTSNSGVTYSTVVQNVTGLLAAGSAGVNHGQCFLSLTALISFIMICVLRHCNGWHHHHFDCHYRVIYPLNYDVFIGKIEYFSVVNVIFNSTYTQSSRKDNRTHLYNKVSIVLLFCLR